MRRLQLSILAILLPAIFYNSYAYNCTEGLSRDELNRIAFIEQTETLELGFKTADYLPENFNPYANPRNIMDISYIEEEQDLELDFDPRLYLPEGFDPYKKNSSSEGLNL